jgi:GNAT superfamily N-acetyltransferase
MTISKYILVNEAFFGMEIAEGFDVFLVKEWDSFAILDLYKAGGWWKETYDPALLPHLVRSSFCFAVGVHRPSGRTVGMGRLISDGVSDGYIQDLVVLPQYRGIGIGRAIVRRLVDFGLSAGVTWIALIAKPGAEPFYECMGFSPMAGFIPMLFHGEGK